MENSEKEHQKGTKLSDVETDNKFCIMKPVWYRCKNRQWNKINMKQKVSRDRPI